MRDSELINNLRYILDGVKYSEKSEVFTLNSGISLIFACSISLIECILST